MQVAADLVAARTSTLGVKVPIASIRSCGDCYSIQLSYERVAGGFTTFSLPSRLVLNSSVETEMSCVEIQLT